jgi:transcription initiation factor TFIIE subunit alpha
LGYREARKVLREVVGENGLMVLEACKKGELTDEEIMDRTGFQLNVIRSLLNQLHYAGLISYDREKDAKTNWYTYTWFVNKGKINQVVREQWQDRMRVLEQKLDDESNYVFFECVEGCEKLAFELAAEYDFKCPECGKEMQHVDNKVVIASIVKEIKEIQKSLHKLDGR